LIDWLTSFGEVNYQLLSVTLVSHYFAVD